MSRERRNTKKTVRSSGILIKITLLTLVKEKEREGRRRIGEIGGGWKLPVRLHITSMRATQCWGKEGLVANKAAEKE